MDAIKLSGVILILAIGSPANAQPLSHSEAQSLSPQLRSLGRIWIRASPSGPDDGTGDSGSGGLPTALWVSPSPNPNPTISSPFLPLFRLDD